MPNSSLKYYTIDNDTRYYVPITDKYTFRLMGTLGFGSKYGKTIRYPFFKHYYVGGMRSIRGFEERTLGPKDSQGRDFGGNFLVNGSAAIIFPPPFLEDAQSVRTSLFFDAGQVYDTEHKVRKNGSSRNPSGFRYSVGFSLVWQTPMNIPIEIALAKPLNAKPGEDTEMFAFSLGADFF